MYRDYVLHTMHLLKIASMLDKQVQFKSDSTFDI